MENIHGEYTWRVYMVQTPCSSMVSVHGYVHGECTWCLNMASDIVKERIERFKLSILFLDA